MARIRRWLLVFVGLLLVCVFALTDSAPRTDQSSAPTAMQAGAARDAALKLRRGVTATAAPQPVQLDNTHLDALSALASHGFSPSRLNMSVTEGVLNLAGSHQLPLGRWLNVEAEVQGESAGFPDVSASFGSVLMSPGVVRLVAEAGRWGVNLGGADIPPLDDLVEAVGVKDDSVLLTLDLPQDTGLLDRLISAQGGVNSGMVVDAFCRLAKEQSATLSKDFAVLTRRAFGSDSVDAATVASNKAALVALAMAVVDKRVGLLAGVDEARIADCNAPASAILLHGRRDLPKHWALSAAIEATAGSQFAEAIGEWKELADTLPGQSRFQIGGGTGFSFVDIAADRSGLCTAAKAGLESEAKGMAVRLSRVTQDDLLPPALLSLREGRGVDFSGEFGSIEDDRYRKAIETIDAVLDEKGLMSPVP